VNALKVGACLGASLNAAVLVPLHANCTGWMLSRRAACSRFLRRPGLNAIFSANRVSAIRLVNEPHPRLAILLPLERKSLRLVLSVGERCFSLGSILAAAARPSCKQPYGK